MHSMVKKPAPLVPWLGSQVWDGEWNCSHSHQQSVHYSHQQSPSQCSTVLSGTVLYRTVQYNTVEYSTKLYSAVQYSAVQHSTVHYCTVLYCTVHHLWPQYSVPGILSSHCLSQGQSFKKTYTSNGVKTNTKH